MFDADIIRWRRSGEYTAKSSTPSGPAASMIEVSALIDPGLLVEIEADAVVL